jgi:hypothetical protein
MRPPSLNVAPAGGRRSAAPADLLVVAGRERTVLASGFLAGLCVFFAPLAFLAVGLLAAYLASRADDGARSFLSLARPIERSDFRGVFAPAVEQAPLLLTAGLLGAALAHFRRWLWLRRDAFALVYDRRPYFPELALVYVLLVGLALFVAGTRGGWPQVARLLHAAPAFFLLMVCATWLSHAVWSYAFGNLIELLSSGPERDAAAALRGRGRRLGPRGSHA